MKSKNSLLYVILPSFGMLILILDAKLAISAATEGIVLCLKTAIPSLFPFFYLSAILNCALLGKNIGFFRPIRKLCRIPRGSESLFVIGLVGGYPMGAATIYDAYRSGAISKNDAERMLGFCNNIGPAFLFGISAVIFDSIYIPFILYGITILSSILTGILLPGGSIRQCQIPHKAGRSPLKSAISAMASVSGWVILFRILLNFCQKWFLWVFPPEVSLWFSGILELTNGCISLGQIPDVPEKLINMCLIANFGGLCVAMQTVSVTEGLSCKFYFLGKVLQSTIAFTLSFIICALLFPGNIPPYYCIISAVPILGYGIRGKLKNNAGNYINSSV